MSHSDTNSDGYTTGVMRYVIVQAPDEHGNRSLAQAAQGRYTYDTPEEAQRIIDALLQNNTEDMLRSVYRLPLYITTVECWPLHHDPKHTYGL